MNFTKPSTIGFTIYSKSGCPNCMVVKKIIKEKHFLLQEINCNNYILENKEHFLKFIETITGYSDKKFPIVFYEDKFIGGLNETKLLIEKLLLTFEDVF